jgi:hypothetical protein
MAPDTNVPKMPTASPRNLGESRKIQSPVSLGLAATSKLVAVAVRGIAMMLRTIVLLYF